MSLVDVNRNRTWRAIVGGVFPYAASYKNYGSKNRAIVLMLATAILLSTNSHAQEIRANGYLGYVFDDAVSTSYSNSTYFNGTLKGGALWGVGLEYMVGQNYGMELLYLRQDTHAPISYYDFSSKQADFDVAANWVMLGFNKYIIHNPKIQPFGGFELGVATFNVKNPETEKSGTVTKFAWGLRLGGEFFFSGNVGLKLQTNLMSAVQAVGGAAYFGTGGSGVAVTGYSSLLQFGLGGGVVFRFKNH